MREGRGANTSFSNSEMFRSTEKMSLPLLPRLRMQTRHIPRAMPFYFQKIIPKSKLPSENRCLVPNVYAKIDLQLMTKNLN